MLEEALHRRAFLLRTQQLFSTCTVATLLGCSTRWVQKWTSRGRSGINFANHPCTGRPPLSTAFVRREVHRRLTRRHKVTSARLVAKEVGVSEASVRCWRRQMDIPAHRPQHKPLLTP